MADKFVFLFLLMFPFLSLGAEKSFLVVSRGETDFECTLVHDTLWNCGENGLLFTPPFSVAQMPTLHQVEGNSVVVPLRVGDPQLQKTLFLNKNNFQYQLAEQSSFQAYYRKHNLMVGFEPALRQCKLDVCMALHQRIFPENTSFIFTATKKIELEKNLDFSFNKAHMPDPTKTSKELFLLFEKLKADFSLRYDYLRDGCFARSHVVSHLLDKSGFHVRKIWVYGFGLWGRGQARDDDFFAWRYHTAPVVKIGSEYFVVDPGLFEYPVDPALWIEKISGPHKTLSFQDQFDDQELALQGRLNVTFSSWETYPDQRSYRDYSEGKEGDLLNAVDYINELPR